jgi:RNA polymerase sigma-70 factor (ECF subfamily)
MSVRELQPPCASVAIGRSASPSADRTTRAEVWDAEPATPGRLRSVIDRHYDSLWRTIRYLGVEDAVAEDAVQKVLCVLARRLGDIAPGAEMSFLFATALRVASETRRAQRRRHTTSVENIDTFAAVQPTPEELVDKRRAHQVLRELLQDLPIDLRVVFVLFEIEELKLVEISRLLGLSMGTVASRLRRARERFQRVVRAWMARRSGTSGGR